MPRPVILGVVGDSATGKTTLTRGLVRVLGDEPRVLPSTLVNSEGPRESLARA